MDLVGKIAKAGIQIAKLQEREVYEARLIDFAEYIWPVVEPAIPFVRGWAIEAIAEHLQAVTEGHIRRLLMNVPPGFTKSLMTDVFWPAWEWGPRNMPWLRYVCSSYSNHLTERDNMRCRNIVISDRYQKMWSSRFKISNEQFTKIKFANDRTGWKLATSVGGIGVGERGDRFIIDDPNNTMDMESEQVRDTTNLWFTEVVPDRLNNPQKSAIVIIQQRLHEDDVSGIALSREMGYTHLCIPMEYDPIVYVNGFDADRQIKTFIGDAVYQVPKEDIFWADPRQFDGELAWPNRFTEQVCSELKRDKGPYAWAGQYQQSPEPRGGAIIKREFWQDWTEDRFPPLEYILASVDTASTDKEENDPSALTIWGVFRDTNQNPKLILMHAWQERLQFHQLLQRIIDTCSLSQKPKSHPQFNVDRVLIEAKSNGIAVGQELHRLIRGTGRFGVELNPVEGDKYARLLSVQHLFSDEMIFAPRDKQYAEMVINQCALFPKGSRDDLVDSTSQALRYLRDQGFALRREEYSVVAYEEMLYHGSRANQPLYGNF